MPFFWLDIKNRYVKTNQGINSVFKHTVNTVDDCVEVHLQLLFVDDNPIDTTYNTVLRYPLLSAKTNPVLLPHYLFQPSVAFHNRKCLRESLELNLLYIYLKY